DTSAAESEVPDGELDENDCERAESDELKRQDADDGADAGVGENDAEALEQLRPLVPAKRGRDVRTRTRAHTGGRRGSGKGEQRGADDHERRARQRKQATGESRAADARTALDDAAERVCCCELGLRRRAVGQKRGARGKA